MLIEIKTISNTYRPSHPGRALVLECDVCHKRFEKKFTQHYLDTHKWGHFCSRKCYGIFRAQHPALYIENTAKMHLPGVGNKISVKALQRTQAPGYVHSQTGLKRSEETRALLKQRKAENPLVGEKNGMWGRKHKETSKEAMSDKHTTLLITGQKRPYGGNSKKGDYTSSKSGREHFYKSGWELALMQWLDANPDVASWDYECVRIPYPYNNHKRWYVPDFVVSFQDAHREMWEVKPKEFVGSEKVQLKSEAARGWCSANGVSAYHVLVGDDLRTMQVI
jgi:hypothetical protein